MNIDRILCPESIEDKLASKHHLKVAEARQVLNSPSRIRFAEHGRTAGEDVYVAFGQTASGRYIAVFFIYKPKTRTAIIISGRDMTPTEKRAYGRK